jgi:cytoskeletal protein CcmA (bactofilin family)
MNNKISVPSRSTVTLDFVDGDLNVGSHAVVEGTGSPPTVRVSGTVYCEEEATFECNLQAGSLEAEDNVTIRGDLTVEDDVDVSDGRLEVHGKMTANHIDVDEALYVNEDLTADNVDVGGSLQVDGNVKVADINVGGSFKAKGEVETENVDIGGIMTTESKVNIQSLDVGGAAKVNGGKIRDIDVGGSFESTAPLEFEKIDVGGAVRLSGKSKGGDVEVGGSINTDEGVSASFVEIGRRGEVHGPIKADEVIIGRDAHVQSIYGRRIYLRSGAHADKVYGENITIESHCDISGEVRYTNELRISNNVSMSKPPQKVDKISF